MLSFIWIFYLIFLLVLLFLQIFLSKKENKWLGLILPIIFFTLSILAALGTPLIKSSIANFLFWNIPTAILLTIYASCRGNKKHKKDLEKMNIQDLQ